MNPGRPPTLVPLEVGSPERDQEMWVRRFLTDSKITGHNCRIRSFMDLLLRTDLELTFLDTSGK